MFARIVRQKAAGKFCYYMLFDLTVIDALNSNDGVFIISFCFCGEGLLMSGCSPNVTRSAFFNQRNSFTQRQIINVVSSSVKYIRNLASFNRFDNLALTLCLLVKYKQPYLCVIQLHSSC